MAETAMNKLNVEGFFRLLQEDAVQAHLDAHGAYVVATIARGALGNEEKFKCVAEFLGIDASELDPVQDWDVLEAAANEVVDELNRVAYERGLEGTFSFEHNETDGDFDLFFRLTNWEE